MTDAELQRRKAICDAAGVDEIGNLSDGFHTFNSLYEQRMILFAALVKAYKNQAWKSYRHEDGEYCFGGGWFIVGIDTPEGSYTYHYENKYWDMFDCVDLPRGKHWDGHTEADAETRLMSLPSAQPYSKAEIQKMQELESAQLEKAYELGRESAQPEQQWIPFKTRSLTEEEKEEHPEWEYVLYGNLPDDGQRILVNIKYKGHEAVQMDEYVDDGGDCYLDSGYDIGTEATAWMQLPEPYKEDDHEPH